jgi:membrane protease YdiL (CAAX protease family)
MNKVKAVFFCFIFAAIYIAMQLLSGNLLAMFFLSRGTQTADLERMVNNNAYLVQIIAVCFFAIVVLAYRRIGKNKIWKVERPGKNVKIMIFSIVLTLAFSLLWCILTANENFNNAALIEQSLNYYSRISPFLGYSFMILSVIIIAPFGEELLCRRMMIGRLQKEFSMPVSILISALIFGIIHIQAGGILLGSGTFLMGIILGFIYVSSGSNFSLAVGAHAIANCADFIFAFLPQSAYFCCNSNAFVHDCQWRDYLRSIKIFIILSLLIKN